MRIKLNGVEIVTVEATSVPGWLRLRMAATFQQAYYATRNKIYGVSEGEDLAPLHLDFIGINAAAVSALRSVVAHAGEECFCHLEEPEKSSEGMVKASLNGGFSDTGPGDKAEIILPPSAPWTREDVKRWIFEVVRDSANSCGLLENLADVRPSIISRQEMEKILDLREAASKLKAMAEEANNLIVSRK